MFYWSLLPWDGDIVARYPDEPHDGGGDDRETVMVLALASIINIVGGSSASVKEKNTMLKWKHKYYKTVSQQ